MNLSALPSCHLFVVSSLGFFAIPDTSQALLVLSTLPSLPGKRIENPFSAPALLAQPQPAEKGSFALSGTPETARQLLRAAERKGQSQPSSAASPALPRCAQAARTAEKSGTSNTNNVSSPKEGENLDFGFGLRLSLGAMQTFQREGSWLIQLRARSLIIPLSFIISSALGFFGLLTPGFPHFSCFFWRHHRKTLPGEHRHSIPFGNQDSHCVPLLCQCPSSVG